ncbi:MalY/PatB family protein [Alkalibacillus aidingensis]|uniref:MalY/PatB family protein n=1 Tax=Alkalibacillus aidingensis TaxID=2747607 RepID=UPI001661751B|nr:PatB family C-S lyase [Alkalibacillus aidingensis]
MSSFKQSVDREFTKAVKYDFRYRVFGRDDLLPMWVADMDLPAPKALQEAIIERAKHNLYGYTTYDHHTLNAIKQWIEKRHQYAIDTNLISFSPGVIPSLHALVQSFTEEDDQIVIQPPVYPPFFSVIKNHNRTVVENPLVQKNHRYEINFEQLEQQFKNGAKAFILCSPHNPVGRVWTIGELNRIAELCIKYKVLLFSDEIHSDIIFRPNKHTPIASLNEEISQLTFTLMAPSKTFNVAGLQGSYVINPNQEAKKQFEKQLGNQGLGILNTFAYTAIEATYQYGEKWLEKLITQLEENRDILIKSLNNSDTQIKPITPEGTYLIWLDFSETSYTHKEIVDKLKDEAKVGLNDGVTFGKDTGRLFMRINIACPPSIVEEGVKRIIETFER